VTLIRASMATAIPDRSKVLNGLETLVIGTVGGLLFLWAELPGGLISGAMVAVAIAALAGRPLAVPAVLTQSVLLLLGISLGSLMSQQLLQHMSSYPLTIGLLALATFCSTFGSSLYLQRVHGWDQTSALLAGSPGALSQITILAAEKGADCSGEQENKEVHLRALYRNVELINKVKSIIRSHAGEIKIFGKNKYQQYNNGSSHFPF